MVRAIELTGRSRTVSTALRPLLKMFSGSDSGSDSAFQAAVKRSGVSRSEGAQNDGRRDFVVIKKTNVWALQDGSGRPREGNAQPIICAKVVDV